MSSILDVLIILVIVMVGYVLVKEGWFDDQTPSLVAKPVTKMALPCYVIYTIAGRLTTDELLKVLPQLRFPAFLMTILLTIAMAVVQLFAVDKKYRGLSVSMFFNSNTIFVGLPISQVLFSGRNIPHVLICYMCNATFFRMIGTYFIQKDGRHSTMIGLHDSLRGVFSPPLLGFIIGIILVSSDIQLPTLLLSDLRYSGNLTALLSMTFIGISVVNAGLSRLRFSKDNVLALLGRFVITPLLMMVIISHTQILLLMEQVLIIQSAMLVMTSAPTIAKLYGTDASYATIMVTESTFLTVLTVPISICLVNYLWFNASQ